MSKDYIYCSHCGTKNPRNHKFCVKCGAKLYQSAGQADNRPQPSQGQPKQFNDQLLNPSKAAAIDNENKLNKRLVWILLAVLTCLVIGLGGYKAYERYERNTIYEIVDHEFSKSDYRAKIDQDDHEVLIVPKSDEEKTAVMMIATMYADGDAADSLDDSVKNVSKKIDDELGGGWVVAYQNPANKKRFFWIYKDGKCKYRMQDHVTYYGDSDDDDDYGDDYDFD